MTDHSADETAIREHVQAFADALNQGDARAVAELFAPDGGFH
jgi:uncharacterized protein (TIGR02246 family)